MKFLYEYTWKDMIWFVFISFWFMLIAIISLQTDKTAVSELQNTTVRLASWRWDGTPRHKALIVTDADGQEYYVDTIFLAEGAFKTYDWNSMNARKGDTLDITYHQEENGTRSIFAISSNRYIFMTVDGSMRVEMENNKSGRNGAIFFAILAIVFILPILAKGFISFKISKNDANGSIETEMEIVNDKLEGMNIYSPFYCTIHKLHVSIGEIVKSGDNIITIVVLDMQIPIVAEMDGIIREIYVSSGDIVEKNTMLVYIENLA